MGYSVYQDTVGKDAMIPLRRRVLVRHDDGTTAYLAQADVSAASYTVHKRLADGTLEAIEDHTDIELDVAETIYDDLQDWDADATGFNVEVVLSSDLASPFTEWGAVYLVHVQVELVDGLVDGFGWLLRTPSL